VRRAARRLVPRRAQELSARPPRWTSGDLRLPESGLRRAVVGRAPRRPGGPRTTVVAVAHARGLAPLAAPAAGRVRRLKKITVLRVIDRLNVGGPAIHAVLTARGLDPERFRTVLVIGSVE